MRGCLWCEQGDKTDVKMVIETVQLKKKKRVKETDKIIGEG